MSFVFHELLFPFPFKCPFLPLDIGVVELDRQEEAVELSLLLRHFVFLRTIFKSEFELTVEDAGAMNGVPFPDPEAEANTAAIVAANLSFK